MKHSFITSCAAALLLACPAAMAQDECATAPTLVSGVASAFNTATSTATTPPLPPNDAQCAGTFLDWIDTQPDVWFKWTATEAGEITLSTCLTGSYDTSMVLYSGSCGALTQVACNGDGPADAGCQNFYSKISNFAVTPGTTYFVRVGGYQGEVGAGSLLLNFVAGVPGCAGATGACGVVHATPGCNVSSCCSLVCNVVPDCCTVTWDSLCVQTAVSECGIFVYNCQNPVPPNDCANNPQVITASGVYGFNSTNANTDGPAMTAGACSSGNSSNFHDVWWRFTAVANGDFTMSTCNLVGFDSKVAVYDLGTGFNPATFDYNTLADRRIGCNDDGANCSTTTGTTFASLLTVPTQVGHTYLFTVAGYDDPDQGIGSVEVTLPTPCALPSASAFESEACGANTNGGCNSTPVAVEPIFVNTSLQGSFYSSATTRDTDWYEFTIPGDRTVTVSVKSASTVNVTLASADCPQPAVYGVGTGSCPTTATACLAAGTYRVIVSPNFVENPCGNGVFNDYSLEITSVVPATPCPITVSQTCANPGPDTQVVGADQPGPLGGLVACAVAPAFPNCSGGGTTRNRYARVVPAAQVPDELSCLKFGVFSVRRAANAANTACANFASDIPLPAKIGIYRDTNGGAPTNAFLADGSCPDAPGSCDMVLLAEYDVKIPGGAYNAQLSLTTPLCLENVPAGQNLVIVMDCPDLYTAPGQPGVPPAAGYGIRPAGNTVAGEVPDTYCRLSCGDGAGAYVLTNTLGATFTANWSLALNGTMVGCGGAACFGDVNDDGQVNGADLGLLLGAWGACQGCPADLNEDGVVNGADLGLLLGAWGPCA